MATPSVSAIIARGKILREGCTVAVVDFGVLFPGLGRGEAGAAMFLSTTPSPGLAGAKLVVFSLGPSAGPIASLLLVVLVRRNGWGFWCSKIATKSLAAELRVLTDGKGRREQFMRCKILRSMARRCELAPLSHRCGQSPHVSRVCPAPLCGWRICFLEMPCARR